MFIKVENTGKHNGFRPTHPLRKSANGEDCWRLSHSEILDAYVAIDAVLQALLDMTGTGTVVPLLFVFGCCGHVSGNGDDDGVVVVVAVVVASFMFLVFVVWAAAQGHVLVTVDADATAVSVASGFSPMAHSHDPVAVAVDGKVGVIVEGDVIAVGVVPSFFSPAQGQEGVAVVGGADIVIGGLNEISFGALNEIGSSNLNWFSVDAFSDSISTFENLLDNFQCAPSINMRMTQSVGSHTKKEFNFGSVSNKSIDLYCACWAITANGLPLPKMEG